VVERSGEILGDRTVKKVMSKINADWHKKNKMPKNPTVDQRIEWHLAHAKNCQCRPLGGKILDEIKKRGIKV
jgi:hypothetical protein